MQKVLQFVAKPGPDGKLHLDIPVGGAAEYRITAVIEPFVAGMAASLEENGWPPGHFEQTYGSITDESFVAPERDSVKPIRPLDGE